MIGFEKRLYKHGVLGMWGSMHMLCGVQKGVVGAGCIQTSVPSLYHGEIGQHHNRQESLYTIQKVQSSDNRWA